MLHNNVDALCLNGGNLVGAHHTGQEAILGVVLKVTTAVGGAVNVVAGTVQAGNVGLQAVVADDLADLGHDLGVEGGGHNVLRGEGGGSQLALVVAQQAGGQTLGTVLVTGAGGFHALDGHGPVEGVADQGVHLVEGHLIQQLVPLGIVVVQTDHIVQLDAVLGAQGGHLDALVVGRIVTDVLQILLEQLGQGQLNGFGGQGAVPVRAAQPGHGFLNTLVQVGVGAGKLVGDGGAVFAGGIGGGVEGVLGPGVGQVGVAVGGHLAVGGLDGVALGSQNVVDGVVGIGGGGEVVVTGVEDVGAGAVGVVGSDVALVDGHGQRLGSARLDAAGLAEADQRNGRLLHTVFLVVVGVGALDIDLHGLFARHITGVGDLDGDGVGVIGGIVADVHIADSKVGVAHAVAEGVCHDIAVGVVACVAVIGDEVLVAGFVVLVAYIDAFLVDHVGLCLGGNIAALNVAFVDSGGEVPHSGGAEVVVAVGIDQAAGGVDLAGQDLGHGVDAGDAHVTDPQRGVDVVLVVLEEIDLQGVGGVDQQDGLFDGAVLLHLGNVLQHRLLVLVKRQIVDLAVGKVSTLAADAGQGHDSGIAVLGNAVLDLVGVDIPRHLGGDLTGSGDHTALGAGVVLAGADGVEVPQRGVDGDTDLFEGGAQGVGGGGINIAGAGAAVHEVDAAAGEGADLRVGSQRQRIVVVHQQGSALGLDLLGQSQTVVDHLLGGVEVTGVILGVGVLVLQLPEAAAEAGRHGVVELCGKHGQRHEKDHNDRAEDRQDFPQRNGLTLSLFVGFFQSLFLGLYVFHLVFSLLVFSVVSINKPPDSGSLP